MSLLGDLRHGRGFGIHSPWAYNMVMDVLRHEEAYYHYPAINRTFKDKRRQRIARAVFRVMISLRPSQISVFGDTAWQKVADLSGCITPGGQRLLIVDTPNVTATQIIDAIMPHGVAVLVQPNPQLIRQLDRQLPQTHGYILDTVRSIAIINLRHDLPRQYLRARW